MNMVELATLVCGASASILVVTIVGVLLGTLYAAVTLKLSMKVFHCHMDLKDTFKIPFMQSLIQTIISVIITLLFGGLFMK